MAACVKGDGGAVSHNASAADRLLPPPFTGGFFLALRTRRRLRVPVVRPEFLSFPCSALSEGFFVFAPPVIVMSVQILAIKGWFRLIQGAVLIMGG